MFVRMGLAGALAAACTLPAWGQTPPTEVGTLTCTAVDRSPAESSDDAAALSCAFKAVQGGYEETYAGTLQRSGEARQQKGMRVLMWTVSAPSDTKLAPGFLEQSYVSSVGAQKSADGTLRGQQTTSLVLRPFAQAEQAPSITVLVLGLKRTRA